MTRPEFAFLMAAIAVAILLLMWVGWRARSRRDAAAEVLRPDGGTVGGALHGTVLFAEPRVQYVSTTRAGQPFDRVALPGLRYRGYAELRVLSDGVEITVTGESPYDIAAGNVEGCSSAQARAGKAVERDGLAVLHWNRPSAPFEAVESSFRFSSSEQHAAFERAIERLLDDDTHVQSMTQEDNR